MADTPDPVSPIVTVAVTVCVPTLALANEPTVGVHVMLPASAGRMPVNEQLMLAFGSELVRSYALLPATRVAVTAIEVMLAVAVADVEFVVVPAAPSV